jgi:hypothetical protein
MLQGFDGKHDGEVFPVNENYGALMLLRSLLLTQESPGPEDEG